MLPTENTDPHPGVSRMTRSFLTMSDLDTNRIPVVEYQQIIDEIDRDKGDAQDRGPLYMQMWRRG
jgi:hypothetical protein